MQRQEMIDLGATHTNQGQSRHKNLSPISRSVCFFILSIPFPYDECLNILSWYLNLYSFIHST